MKQISFKNSISVNMYRSQNSNNCDHEKESETLDFTT